MVTLLQYSAAKKKWRSKTRWTILRWMLQDVLGIIVKVSFCTNSSCQGAWWVGPTFLWLLHLSKIPFSLFHLVILSFGKFWVKSFLESMDFILYFILGKHSHKILHWYSLTWTLRRLCHLVQSTLNSVMPLRMYVLHCQHTAFQMTLSTLINVSKATQ